MIEVGPNTHIHGMPPGEMNYGVAVTEADPKYTTEPLPIPVGDEMTIVAHAIGSQVAWPKNLVIFDDTLVRFF